MVEENLVERLQEIFDDPIQKIIAAVSSQVS